MPDARYWDQYWRNVAVARQDEALAGWVLWKQQNPADIQPPPPTLDAAPRPHTAELRRPWRRSKRDLDRRFTDLPKVIYVPEQYQRLAFYYGISYLLLETTTCDLHNGRKPPLFYSKHPPTEPLQKAAYNSWVLLLAAACAPDAASFWRVLRVVVSLPGYGDFNVPLHAIYTNQILDFCSTQRLYVKWQDGQLTTLSWPTEYTDP